MSAPWLENCWYVAALSHQINARHPIRLMIAGKPIVFARSAVDKSVFALADQCPHRGAPLSQGRLVHQDIKTHIECPYHGWQFAPNGQCAHIPALSAKDPASGGHTGIATQAYPVKEEKGLIWVFIHDEEARRANKQSPELAPAISLPQTGIPGKWKPSSHTILDTQGPFMEAVTGLVDPAHTPYVHKQWWWRSGRLPQEKTKNYQKLPFGFRIPFHQPSSNSRIYSFFGGVPKTQIDFLIPSLRVETVELGTKKIIGLTAITPIKPGINRIFHLLYWDLWQLTMMRPIVSAMALSFLSQDAKILHVQAMNLGAESDKSILLGEPDMPAIWLHQLTSAWQNQIKGPSPDAFNNPIKTSDLNWRT